MTRVLIFTASLLLCRYCTAQEVDVFKVSKRPITIQPDVSVLAYNHDYQFIIKNLPAGGIDRIVFKEGKATIRDSVLDVWVYPKAVSDLNFDKRLHELQLFDTAENALLPVFEKKIFLIDSFEMPKYTGRANRSSSRMGVYCWNKELRKSDSISMKQLLTGNTVLGFNNRRPDVGYMIASFRMNITGNGQDKVFYSRGNNFTSEMSDAMKTLTPGCVITLSQIFYICTSSYVDNSMAGPYEICVKE